MYILSVHNEKKNAQYSGCKCKSVLETETTESIQMCTIEWLTAD